jgi:hypothetical protein
MRRALVDVLPGRIPLERVEISENGAVVTSWSRYVGFPLGRRQDTRSARGGQLPASPRLP